LKVLPDFKHFIKCALITNHLFCVYTFA